MKKRNYAFYILVLVAFLSLTITLVVRTFQNDTFYTIKIGETITKYGIDMKDHFSFVPNLMYTYPHWLYDLIMYLLYSLGGFNAIYISTLALGFLLLFLMYFLCNKIIDNKIISFILSFIFGVMLYGYITARAQLVSYILLLIILYSIEKLRSCKKKKYIFYIFISSLLISNMHLAVWPFIFVLFLPFIVQDIIYLTIKKYNLKFVNKFNIEIEKSSLKITLVALFISFLTGFLTPNFLVPFTYLLNTYSGVSTEFISEHSPMTFSYRPEFYIFLLLFLILILFKKTKIKLRDLFLICGLILLTFMSRRSVALFFVLSLFSFGRLCNYKSVLLENVIYSKLFTSILTIFFIVSSVFVFKYQENRSYVDQKKYPVIAASYIINNLDYKNIRLYNGYDFGSYLIYRGIPVFIDSRADLYLEEFNKNTYVLKDYMNMFYNYEELFKKYDFKYFLLDNSDKLNKVLTKDKYKIIYVDKYFTLYEVLT